MAINIGPFKNVIRYNASTKNGQFRFVSTFAFGWTADFVTDFSWGINGRELGRENGVFVQGSGPDPAIDITIDDIREALNSLDPPIEVTNSKIKLYVNFSVFPGAEGNSWTFRSFDMEGVQKDIEFPEMLHPMINNPIQLDLNTLQWTFPAPT